MSSFLIFMFFPNWYHVLFVDFNGENDCLGYFEPEYFG